MHPSEDRQAIVAVVGAGAAGVAASLAAARAGVKVVLLEAGGRIGGTVTRGLIHTLAGLVDARGAALTPGLPAELVARLRAADATARPRRIGRVTVLAVEPGAYQGVVEAWLAEEAAIEVRVGHRLVGVAAAEGRIHALEVRGGGSGAALEIAALCDTSGEAAACALLDPDLVARDSAQQSIGLICRLQGVGADLSGGLASAARAVELQRAIAADDLRRDVSSAWLDAGQRGDELYIKLGLTTEGAQAAADPAVARAICAAVQERLRPWAGFAGCRIAAVGEPVARSGPRLRGRDTLRAQEVREGRRRADAACSASYPMEFWDPARGVQVEHLRAGLRYDVPFGALRAPRYDNLWVAGRCLSAEPLAQSSARVVGTCWAMGQAVGRAAAAWARGGR